jgi:hypothetical protein
MQACQCLNTIVYKAFRMHTHLVPLLLLRLPALLSSLDDIRVSANGKCMYRKSQMYISMYCTEREQRYSGSQTPHARMTTCSLGLPFLFCAHNYLHFGFLFIIGSAAIHAGTFVGRAVSREIT